MQPMSRAHAHMCFAWRIRSDLASCAPAMEKVGRLQLFTAPPGWCSNVQVRHGELFASLHVPTAPHHLHTPLVGHHAVRAAAVVHHGALGVEACQQYVCGVRLPTCQASDPPRTSHNGPMASGLSSGSQIVKMLQKNLQSSSTHTVAPPSPSASNTAAASPAASIIRFSICMNHERGRVMTVQ